MSSSKKSRPVNFVVLGSATEKPPEESASALLLIDPHGEIYEALVQWLAGTDSAGAATLQSFLGSILLRGLVEEAQSIPATDRPYYRFLLQEDSDSV